jgi:hypothetical protein
MVCGIPKWTHTHSKKRLALSVVVTHFLTSQCVSTRVGEENLSLYSSIIPSISFYYKERLFVDVIDVETTFFQEWIKNKMNFLVIEMTLMHCLV